MGDKTGISWTMGDDGSAGSTWNYLRGCTEFGDDCANCYAKRIGARFSGVGQAYHGFARMKHTAGGKSLPQWTGEVAIIAEHLLDPVRWKEPRKIFCVSVSDPFHEKLTNIEIAVAYGVMAIAGRHTFQNLTKRSKRRREWFAWVAEAAKKIDQSPAMYCYLAMRNWVEQHGMRGASSLRKPEVIAAAQAAPWPLPWVWEGVSAGHQRAADERIPDLIATPAAVRFVSLEPLIGKVILDNGESSWLTCRGPRSTDDEAGCCESRYVNGFCFRGIDWVIAGCESGDGARPCEVDWLRSLRDQCATAEVPFFLKQAQQTMEVAAGAFGCRGARGGVLAVTGGPGAKKKGRAIFELPYLDGVQHKAFPEVSR